MLRYEKTNEVTNESIVVELPIAEAIQQPTTFLKDGFIYKLKEWDKIEYLIHKYAKHLHVPVTTNGIETYAEMYQDNPEGLVQLIEELDLKKSLEADIEHMYKMYDEMEQRMKEYDDYINGHLSY